MRARSAFPVFSVLFSMMFCACGGKDDSKDTLVVTLTSPQGNSYVSGQVTVTAEVQGTAQRVALFVDGALVEVDETAPYAFTWDTAQATEATHRLEAFAYGADGGQGRSGEIVVIVDRTSPVVELPELQYPLLYSGSTNALEALAADDAGIAELRLLVDGALVDSCEAAECTFDFDVSSLADGEAILTIEAEDAVGNQASRDLPVLVVNDGTPIAFIEGAGTANWVIPESWQTMDLDMKFHFDMPAGVTAMMAALQWSRTEWPFVLAVGTGECPHSGVLVADVDGEGGQAILEHTAAELSLAEYDQVGWFIHLAAGTGLDMGANVGEGTRVAFVMVLY